MQMTLTLSDALFRLEYSKHRSRTMIYESRNGDEGERGGYGFLMLYAPYFGIIGPVEFDFDFGQESWNKGR